MITYLLVNTEVFALQCIALDIDNGSACRIFDWQDGNRPRQESVVLYHYISIISHGAYVVRDGCGRCQQEKKKVSILVNLMLKGMRTPLTVPSLHVDLVQRGGST